MKQLVVVCMPFLIATSVSATSVVVSPQVAKLVVPVLKAHAVSAKHETEESAAALDSALAKVLDTRTATGNEALAVLLCFYIGEGSGDEAWCEAVSRGKLMLPLLRKYETVEVVVPGIDPITTEPSKASSLRVRRDIDAGHKCQGWK